MHKNLEITRTRMNDVKGMWNNKFSEKANKTKLDLSNPLSKKRRKWAGSLSCHCHTSSKKVVQRKEAALLSICYLQQFNLPGGQLIIVQTMWEQQTHLLLGRKAIFKKKIKLILGYNNNYGANFNLKEVLVTHH